MTAAASAAPRSCGHTAGARSVAEHAALAVGLLEPVGAEGVALVDALGRRLAVDVRAGGDLPAVDSSAMDGYAVRAAELGPRGLPVVADVPAGSTAGPLVPGTAQRVMTGAPLPAGADTVVPVEVTDDGRSWVHLTGPVSPGRHVRRRAEDVRRGEVLLPAGLLLGPTHLGVAAACGLGVLHVHRRLRVAVLSAGSELVAAGRPCRPGQVPDSNGAVLVAALRGAGALVEQLPLVPDHPAELDALLARRLPGFDLLVTSGGISAGDHEVVKDALRPHGVDFGPVALRPGGTHGLGRVRGTPVVCLPGNPVACWVGFQLVVRPAVRAASHAPDDAAPSTARARSAFRGSAGRCTAVPAVHDPVTGEVSVVPAAGAHSYRALALADSLVVLDQSGTDAGPGDLVRVVRNR